MKRLQKNSKALSTVVTTLIILVVSVLLAGVVTLYATNITSTRTQQEQLKLTKQAIWVNSTGACYGAISIDNVGGKDVIVSKIQVRGVESAWSKVRYVTLSAPITTSLNFPLTSGNGFNWDNWMYSTGVSNGTFIQAGDVIPLKSGNTMVVYIHSPDSVNLSDIGSTIGITVFTEATQYYVETNVATP